MPRELRKPRRAGRAEIARIECRDGDAMPLYELAIRSARGSGFVHYEAIAYERASAFYRARGCDELADFYLRNARDRYTRWGAEEKVRQLDQLHPQLRQEERAQVPTATIDAPVEQLDLGTVMNVLQAVSGEIVLEKLIDKLMRAAIQNAGAERGLLINPQNDELRIEAEAITRGEDLIVNLGGSANATPALPESLVKYVMRAQETVILDNALSKNPFSADAYIAEGRARSVLCLPLTTQGKLIGFSILKIISRHTFSMLTGSPS
jgi:GAF domain-containing protein